MAETDKPEWTVFGAVGVAVAASACCTGPLVLVSLGVGGAWMSGLTALEPFRPYFIVLAVGMMSFAFVRSYRARRDPDCECDPQANPHAKNLLLGIGALVTAGLIASPWLLPSVLHARAPEPGAAPGDVQEVVLSIQDMTCASCATTVMTVLNRTEGVVDARVTYTPPQAVVLYDPSKVDAGALAAVVTNTGYPAELVPDTMTKPGAGSASPIQPDR
jgi:copper chaperone CopZ